uniref:Odorant receptor n=1 Tax=Campoletis chlorideae TaxID=219166 RepID=A0A346D417_9HYME|nr:odorant receptor [Campoletis chlorideae]
MDFLPTPYLEINRTFLSAIGLWPNQSGFTKNLLLFNLIFFIGTQGFFQVGGMIAAWEDKSVFLESIPPVLIDVVCCAKVTNFILNSDKMKELLSILENDWERFKGRKEIKVLNEYAINGRNLTLSYAGCMYGSMTPFMIIPVVPIVMNAIGPENATVEKQLMFRVDYLLDADKYYYPLLIHSYFGTLAYITLVIAIDTMLMIYVHHACGSFALLGYQLEHLMDGIDIDVDVYPDKESDTRYTIMAECVAQHSHALQYAKRIEDAVFKFNFVQLGITMVCLSFTGFQTVMYADVPEIAVRYIAFTITQLILLFLQSYPGQILYDHSVIVSELANNCDWYLTSIRTRKLFCMMIMRSRIPCFLTAGRFYVLNMANFSAVVRTSISYLTVLTSVK